MQRKTMSGRRRGCGDIRFKAQRWRLVSGKLY